MNFVTFSRSLTALGFLTIAGIASASTITQTITQSAFFTGSNTGNPFSINQFDPTMGTLTSVVISLSWADQVALAGHANHNASICGSGSGCSISGTQLAFTDVDLASDQDQLVEADPA